MNFQPFLALVTTASLNSPNRSTASTLTGTHAVEAMLYFDDRVWGEIVTRDDGQDHGLIEPGRARRAGFPNGIKARGPCS